MMELKFENLVKEYEGRRVLEIETGGVKAGSRTAVIGPNGAGKSTLIQLIAGLIEPTAGKVFYGTAEEIPNQEVTLVFQSPYLITTTVEKNIAYPLKLRGWDEEAIEKRVTELCEELGLTPLRKQKSWKLSGGEVQKVALARALSFHPKLLLLDEPTANIDPATTGEIEGLLRKINEEEATTIIIITHNLAQAKRVCDELLFLHQGKLIERGNCEEMLRSPKTELAERFVRGELLI